MELEEKIKSLQKEISPIIEKRIKEFDEMNRKDDLAWFSELCFCILTANTSAELGLRMQKNLRPLEFATLNEYELSMKLKELGYRFYNTRAKYIRENQKFSYTIKKIILGKKDIEKREWLVQNIKGLGYKESSHFLRNVGYKNFAIIDKHIFNLMKKYGITNEIKITEKNYVLLENELKKIADKLGMDLARLDLYLWYIETGKVIK